jgi:hypothetical protein
MNGHPASEWSIDKQRSAAKATRRSHHQKQQLNYQQTSRKEESKKTQPICTQNIAANAVAAHMLCIFCSVA